MQLPSGEPTVTAMPTHPAPPLRALRPPPPIVPGGTIDVVAPASPFDRALLFRGLGWLRQHFHVRLRLDLAYCRGVTTGDVEYRLMQLNGAFLSDAQVVLCARGGVGCTDLTPHIDWTTFAARPKWLVGFSDITALHLKTNAAGLMSIHAGNASSLGRGDDAQRQRWLEHLLHPTAQQSFPQLDTLYPGTADGTLVGGNLTVLCAETAVSDCIPDGAILFIEEIAEPAFRIHRCLSQLAAAGILGRLGALIVGQLTQCSPTRGESALDVIKSFACRHRLPCLAGVTSGHEVNVNTPLTLGMKASVQPGKLVLSLG